MIVSTFKAYSEEETAAAFQESRSKASTTSMNVLEARGKETVCFYMGNMGY
jgi:hypothetical protein